MTTQISRGFATSVKRTHSEEELGSTGISQAFEASDIEKAEDKAELPKFLRLSKAEIYSQFHSLEFAQSIRIQQGRNDPSSPWTQDLTPQVMLRNRYANVQPWDNTRIHLKVGKGKSDYINASPISLRDPRTGIVTTYIAAQGPKKTNLNHFWHMIWQETTETAVIVMLTQTAEAGREKCFQYFPLNPGASYRIKPFNDSSENPDGAIKLVESLYDERSKCTQRQLLLSFGEESRTVWHLLFAGWPDHTVPEGENRGALLELLKLSVEKNANSSNPRIIHCSAGVGRSGTFIALEHLLKQVESGAAAEADEDEYYIFNLVNSLREQRMMMVQSEPQYEFLFDVVREQFRKWQIAAAIAALEYSEPSPKLRKISRGVKDLGTEETEEKSPLRLDESEAGSPEQEEGKAPLTS